MMRDDATKERLLIFPQVGLPSINRFYGYAVLLRCVGVAAHMIRECLLGSDVCGRVVLFTSFYGTSLCSCETYGQTDPLFNSVLFAPSLGKLLLASSVLLDALSALNK
jgi:hypothetical protein